MNTTTEIHWTRAAIVAANVHGLSPEERAAAVARSAAKVQGRVHVLAVDVLAVARERKAVAA
jgi:hypothetical protein